MLMALATVMAWVLPSLPSVSPPRVEAKVQPEVEKAPPKLVDEGSMRRAPVPVNDLLLGLGALLASTKVPPAMLLPPVCVLLAVNVNVPTPLFVKLVLPEMLPDMVDAAPTLISRLLSDEADELMLTEPEPADSTNEDPAV